MAATKKTDNSFMVDKVLLRISRSPWPTNRHLKVLDVFGGHGLVWSSVQKETGFFVSRVGIDNRKDLKKFHLHGDNVKVLAGLDLKAFDVVDLDAYGYPIAQLAVLFDSGFRGTVFVTAIQTMQGGIPKKLADDLGFPCEVMSKCPTLLARRGFEYFKQWIAMHGVSEIHIRSHGRKHYFSFIL